MGDPPQLVMLPGGCEAAWPPPAFPHCSRVSSNGSTAVPSI